MLNRRNSPVYLASQAVSVPCNRRATSVRTTSTHAAPRRPPNFIARRCFELRSSPEYQCAAPHCGMSTPSHAPCMALSGWPWEAGRFQSSRAARVDHTVTAESVRSGRRYQVRRPPNPFSSVGSPDSAPDRSLWFHHAEFCEIRRSDVRSARYRPWHGRFSETGL